MKVKFFTLVAILIIVVAGFVVYLNLNKDSVEADKDFSTEDITAQPTASPTLSATQTPTVDTSTDTNLYPVYQRVEGINVYGYINAKGEIAIKPSFEAASDFHEDNAVVYMDNQYMVIDKKGSILYSNDYLIRDYQNGMAVISEFNGDNLLYGYIDKEGKKVIQPQFKLASDFSKENTAYVYLDNGKFAKIDKSGKILERYEQDTKYNPSSIQDGYIIYNDNSSNNFGVINVKGEQIIKPNYSDITYLGNDLFALRESEDVVYGMLSAVPAALFNAKGEQVTDYVLYDIGSFYNGVASVTDSTYTYFIGTDGKTVTDLPKFEGRGTVTLLGNVIKADIDGRLTYYKKDSTVIWQEAKDQVLEGGIIVKNNKFKPNKFVYVYYPQIEGLTDSAIKTSINTRLKSLFLDHRKDIKEKDMLSVADSFQATLMKNLLIIEKEGYDYPFGAAHGMPIRKYYYIDITNGSFYEFKDLFLADSEFIKKVNEIVTSEMELRSHDENSMLFFDTFEGISETPDFKISADALTIFFTPYEVAAYAAGFPEFKIPFEEIYDYIDFNGAFWNAFK